SSMSKAVSLSDHKLIEAVAGVEGGRLSERRLLRAWGPRLQGHELDACLFSQDVPDGSLYDVVEAPRDPRPDVGRDRERQDPSVPPSCLQRCQPELVGRFSDDPPQLGADLAPGRRQLGMRG